MSYVRTEAHRKLQSKRHRARWADKNWAKTATRKIRAACKTVTHRRNLSIAITREAQSKNGRLIRSRHLKKLWSDPVWAAKQKKALKAAWTAARCKKRSKLVRKHYVEHPERRAKLSKSRKALFLNPKFAAKHGRLFRVKPSKAELIVRKFLRHSKISYKFQSSMFGFFPDFVLPVRKIVIECDGKYWHSPPSVRKRDKKKDRLFANAGYRVIRVSSEDVVSKTAEVLVSLKRAIG